MPKGVYKRKSISERLWSRVDSSNSESCWLWPGAKTPKGYGKIRYKGECRYVHVVAYALTYGPVPTGLQVNHTCRNRNCCNPTHVYAGTQSQNMYDRTKDKICIGENSSVSVLTENDVLSIRKDLRLYKLIAQEFGVTIGNISYIKSHKSWKHLK